jgi:thymidylate synthase (FAD)
MTTPPLGIIDNLLDGKGYVSVEMVSPYTIPMESDGTFHSDRTRDYFTAKAARASTGLDLKTPKQDKGLIEYLVRNKHTSPLEMCSLTYCIKCPISIGRQFLRHRTGKFNEFSQRYSEVDEEMGWYKPVLDKNSIRGQSKMNAQGSEDNLTLEQKEKISDKMFELEMMSEMMFNGYKELIELGLSREVARFYLTQSTYTVFYIQLDLNNLMKFLTLRCAPDAQYEIQVYANAMKELARKFFPIMIDQMDQEMNKIVLDKWAIQMIKEKKIPEEVKSKSLQAKLEDLAKELNITLI